MKRMTAVALVGVALLLGALVVDPLAQLAQPATIVQQAATRADTATQVSTNVASATTTTLTPNSGESVYVSEVDISNCAGASAVTAAAVTTITTTNLVGSPAWTLGSGVTAGLCTQILSISYPLSLKSQTPGTAVTFVLPTFATNQTIRLNVAWRSAP